MDAGPQEGYLVLADISGYTSYMAGTELEHSHEIMSELLELIVGRLTPALTLAKLEGDAVFVYAPDSRLARGETLLDLIETTYVAFRDHTANMHRRTTCTCAACRAIPTLDLKFMAHHGRYIHQIVAGQHEIVGSDVNLAHRLLKNNVSAVTGSRAYALFSAACSERMPIEQEKLYSGTESYEHLGDIEVHAIDLPKRYQAISEARHIYISAADAHTVMTYDLPAPPPVVWEWLNDPLLRNEWSGGIVWTALDRPNERSGIGARNHCAHGKNESTEVILDWRPFDYCTTRSEVSSRMSLLTTAQLEEHKGGTRLHYHVQLEKPAILPVWLKRPFAKMIMTKMANMEEKWAALAAILEKQEETSPPAAQALVTHSP